MTPRLRFVIALAMSAAIHVTAIVLPAWHLPTSEDSMVMPQLDARLMARRVVPTSFARPSGRRKNPAHRPSPSAPVPTPETSLPPVGSDSVPPASGAESAPLAETNPTTPDPSVAATNSAPPVEQPIAPVPADIGLPHHGRIEYSISRGEQGFVIGRAVHEWHHDGLSYTMQSVNVTTGIVALFRSAKATLTSAGSVTAAGLVPQEYRADRGSSIDMADFDWTSGTVTLSAGNPSVVPLQTGAQDVLSMFYQLGILLRQGGSLPKLSIATGRKFEAYAFESIGEEQLALPFGTQRTLHVSTRSAPGEDRTEIWIGLDRAGLPLKILHVDRTGSSFAQVAEKIEIDGDAAVAK